MPDSNDSPKNVRSFLTRAAHDDGFRNWLEASPADEVRERLREDYGVDVPIPETRTIPPKDVCKALLVWNCWLEEYADVSVRDSALVPILMVVGHAMPLVVSAEEAVGAAG
ncbi:MAG TPA: hypothetical protein VE736_02560 [Gaiellaceae bacterium]|nr:hypothetical protein [Gaiellaceae bacterium]